MISIKNLDFSYNSTKLFENLSIDMEPGKIYGLLGNNGAGKTTLLKIITGLLHPKKGECKILNIESKHRLPALYKDLYFIPESFNLPEMKICDYEFLFSPFYPKFKKEIFNSKIKEFEIDEKINIKKFSFGQRKKLLLAFAIATDCSVLIFDEPTNGLDIPSQRLIRKIFAELAFDNKTVIISTHHVREMENIFDHLVVLDKGKIVSSKSITQLSENLTIKIVTNTNDINSKDIIYTEQIPGGFSVLKLITDEDESKLDLEFIFNAIIKDSLKFESAFNQRSNV